MIQVRNTEGRVTPEYQFAVNVYSCVYPELTELIFPRTPHYRIERAYVASHLAADSLGIAHDPQMGRQALLYYLWTTGVSDKALIKTFALTPDELKDDIAMMVNPRVHLGEEGAVVDQFRSHFLYINNGKIPASDLEVIAMRRQGLSNEDIAAYLELPLSHVATVLSAHMLKGLRFRNVDESLRKIQLGSEDELGRIRSYAKEAQDMLVPRWTRSQQRELLFGAAYNLAAAKAGVRPMMTNKELAVKYRYPDEAAVSLILRKYGLGELRAQLKDDEKVAGYTEGSDVAYIIALLATNGSIEMRKGNITLSSTDPGLQEEFVRLGRRIFNKDAGNNGRKKRFGNMPVALKLGDLRESNWAHTVRERHGWIFQNDETFIAFMRGLVDGGFFIGDEKSANCVYFESAHEDAVLFVQTLLERMGVITSYVNKRSKGVGRSPAFRLAFSTAEDRKIFADQITSVVEKKEKRLALFRDINIEHMWRRISDEDLIEDWIKMTRLLGREGISTYDVRELRARGVEGFSVQTFIRRYGIADDGRRSFTVASRRLREIVRQRQQRGDEDPQLGEPFAN